MLDHMTRNARLCAAAALAAAVLLVALAAFALR